MTRVLTTAEAAAVTAERNRLAWNLPRQPTAASPAALVASVPGVRDDKPVQRVLDWQAFSSLHFSGRQRHDFEALTAYGTYRSALAADEPSDRTGRSVT